MEPEIHKCGRCNNEFTTEQDYLDHKCLALEGETPKESQAMGVAYSVIQSKALERGAARAAEEQ